MKNTEKVNQIKRFPFSNKYRNFLILLFLILFSVSNLLVTSVQADDFSDEGEDEDLIFWLKKIVEKKDFKNDDDTKNWIGEKKIAPEPLWSYRNKLIELSCLQSAREMRGYGKLYFLKNLSEKW